MHYKSWFYFIVAILFVSLGWFLLATFFAGKTGKIKVAETEEVTLAKTPQFDFQIGDAIDSLNGVVVYYNGETDHVEGRNTAADGYNLGLKYQCVEFVKRYYYEHLNHKMPDSYGHAREFFDKSLRDGQKNSQRMLLQFKNPSMTLPAVDDILVFDAEPDNPYGHVAIVSAVSKDRIEVIQQNRLRQSPARESFELKNNRGYWQVQDSLVLGWLRKI